MARGRKVSPAKFIGSVIGGAASIIGGIGANKRAKRAQREARAELDKQKAAYGALDTSNLAANAQNAFSNIQTNFENTAEDLTVNQQQAQFQAQQGAQQRSNIMESMRGAAGGSGIAALAQTMANQGQLATQQASASIGQQEAANQRAMAQGAAREQSMEAQAGVQMAQGQQVADAARLQGAKDARGLEYDKTTNLLSMAGSSMQAANEQRQAARSQISGGISGLAGGLVGGLGAGLTAFGKGGGGMGEFLKAGIGIKKEE